MRATAPAPGEAGRPPPGFLSWWRGELRELMPPRWRQHGAPQRCTLIAPNADGFTVYRRRGRTAAPIGRLTAEGARDTAQARHLQRSRQPVWLMLPAVDGLIARDSLPAGAERDLQKIMRHRIEVLTPWPASTVHADARVTARRADGTLAVDLAVIARDALDPLIARLAAMGVAVDGADLANAAALPAGFDFLHGTGGRRRGRRRLLPILSGGVVVLTLGGWAAVNIIEIERELGQKRRHLAALDERFADLPELRDRLESKRQRASFVAERRRAAVSPTVVLEVMSRTLPDDVWLTELQLDGREVIASGYARDAAAVVPLIEGSRHFAQVRFRSPSTRVELTAADGSSRRVERFSITAAVTPLMDPVR